MQCLTPFQVTHNGEKVPVPCGRCLPCTSRRVSSWSFRLMEQDKDSVESWFVTLTYDTNTVPITRNRFMSLNKRDVQLYIKRLRKKHEKRNRPKIKYFAAGEYGGETRRPHYHILMFNAHVDDILSEWQHGFVHLGKIEEASVGYTLKYIHKGKWSPMHSNDDREPQFQLQSKGLAAAI